MEGLESGSVYDPVEGAYYVVETCGDLLPGLSEERVEDWVDTPYIRLLFLTFFKGCLEEGMDGLTFEEIRHGEVYAGDIIIKEDDGLSIGKLLAYELSLGNKSLMTYDEVSVELGVKGFLIFIILFFVRDIYIDLAFGDLVILESSQCFIITELGPLIGGDTYT